MTSVEDRDRDVSAVIEQIRSELAEVMRRCDDLGDHMAQVSHKITKRPPC